MPGKLDADQARERRCRSIDQMTAANTSGWGIEPSRGSSVTLLDSLTRTGRKAKSVSTALMRLTPRPSMVLAKRMASSWTRWEAPSIVRSRGQLAT